MADQMKSCSGHAGDRRRFTFKLLHVVFAELPQSQGIGFLNGFRREDFGDRQEQDLRWIPPRAPGCPLDARPHHRQSLRKPFHGWFHAPVSHAPPRTRQVKTSVTPTICWCLGKLSNCTFSFIILANAESIGDNAKLTTLHVISHTIETLILLS